MAEEKKEMGKEREAKAKEKKAEKPKARPPEARKETQKIAEVKHAHDKPTIAAAHAHPAPEAQAAAPAPAGKKPKKPRRKKLRVEHARGKRKECIARATVREGSGRIRVNSILTSAIENRYFREIVEEPIALLGPEGLGVDVEVHVQGGGIMGQAQACRTAIARALGKYFGEKALAAFKESDSWMLKEDSRRVEPKKYKGPKARARFQKSYR